MMKMRYPYYYVPECPECGSRCTGRFVRKPLRDSLYVEENSLKNGEIIRFSKGFPQDRVFCVDCGHEWNHHVLVRFLTREELDQEKEERGTEEAYQELLELKKNSNDGKQSGIVRFVNAFLSR